jgi:hypothetical protein
MTWSEVLSEFETAQTAVEHAFDATVNEPKITSRENLVNTLSAPVVPGPSGDEKEWDYSNHREKKHRAAAGSGKAPAPEAMRKHMTAVFDEALGGVSPAGEHVVYLGEDVRHGG